MKFIKFYMNFNSLQDRAVFDFFFGMRSGENRLKNEVSITYARLFGLALALVLVRLGLVLVALGVDRVVVEVGMLEELLARPTLRRVHSQTTLEAN